MSNVILYSSNNCSYCKLVKEFFAENGVDYVEKNVSTDMEARKELMAKGYMGVPVTFIGEEDVKGFDKERLVELLNI